MNEGGSSHPEPIPIGDIASPPFVRLPQPEQIFIARAERCRSLGTGHDLAPYLTFLADVFEAQSRIQAGLPAPDGLGADADDRMPAPGPPPLDRSRFAFDDTFALISERLLSSLAERTMPDTAGSALTRLRRADKDTRRKMAANILEDAIPVDGFAEHAFLAAALQVYFSRRAARLDAARLTPARDGACPACGGPPIASVVVGWLGAHGTRFCVCALCATLWNYVRIKCTLCGSTQGIAYQGLEGDAGTVKAETCDSCRGYVKILYQHKEPALDPVADDVATLGLDLLLREAGYRRGAVNPFLLGY